MLSTYQGLWCSHFPIIAYTQIDRYTTQTYMQTNTQTNTHAWAHKHTWIHRQTHRQMHKHTGIPSEVVAFPGHLDFSTTKIMTPTA